MKQAAAVTEGFYVVGVGMAVLALLSVLTVAMVALYFNRSFRMQLRAAVEDRTVVECSLDTGKAAAVVDVDPSSTAAEVARP